MEAKEQLITVLEAIKVLKEKHKTDYIINFLTGQETSEIETFGHDKLEEFGSGDDEDAVLWDTVIRYALIEHYLSKDIDNYGLLKITKKGKDFLKKPVSFKITKDDFSDMEENMDDEDLMLGGGGGGGAVDPALFSMMKDLRKKLSKKLDVPPYVIFQDTSLEAMAATYPIKIEELQNMPGVGAGKAKRYGKDFVELIKKHVDENEIERDRKSVV